MNKQAITLYLSLVCLAFLSNPAWSSSLLDLKLLDLQEHRSLSLHDFLNKTGSEDNKETSKEKIILLSFFEPNCPWCYRQMKVFNKLQDTCNHSIQPVMVGINGNAIALRKDLRKAKVHFPALKANKQLRQQFDVPATPWTLMIDAEGQLITTIRGYTPFKDFAEVFTEECPLEKT